MALGLSALVACVGGEQTPAADGELASEEPIARGGDYYQEPHRPQLHFTPERAWMNDPNGLVFHGGKYHLFYQHNPDSNVWGPMHWGHATSTDLVQWDHQPIALAPDERGAIFSGSVVVDRANTAGFGGSLDNPALVAVFTYHDHAGEDAGRDDFQTQGLAYSLDGGTTWTKYAGNPVLPNAEGLRDFRDPKVIWHAPSERWVMALAARDHVRFYTSPDLKAWTYASSFGEGAGSHGGIWECPDLFPLREEGSGTERYVLIVSVQDGAPAGGTGTSYFVGDFDGVAFRATDGAREPLWLDYGADNYALVTFADAPLPDTRRLGIGWMSNWRYAQAVPTEAWRSAMTTPRVLTLRETPAGWRVRQARVPDLFGYRARRAEINRGSALKPTNLTPALTAWDDAPVEIVVPTPGGAVPDFAFRKTFAGGDTLTFGYDAAAQQYFVDRSGLASATFDEDYAARHEAPRKTYAQGERIRILVDRSSVELFADDGFTVLTDTYYAGGAPERFALLGETDLTITIHELRAALPTPGSVARARLGL